MKIIAVADIHGKQKYLEAVVGNVKTYKPDALVIAGDIASRRTKRSVMKIMSDLSLPILFVQGNADSSAFVKEMQIQKNLTDLHLNNTLIAGISFVGLSGTVPLPFFSKIRMTEKPLLEKLKQRIQPDSVLVTHTPPRGSVDRVLGRFHAGSKGLASFVDSVQPKLVICGHIHEDAGIVYRGNSCIVNCSLGAKNNGVLIEFGENASIEGITSI